MKGEHKIKIFLVDDDAVFLKLLEIEFSEHTDFIVETYPTGELCMAHIAHNPDMIILDYHLDGIDKNAMNGIETLDQIKGYNQDIPVAMLSQQDKIEIAISCMHHKAFDYVVKSETAFVRLQKIIATFFNQKKLEKQINWYMERI